MPSAARNPGVQSWSFRNFKTVEAMLGQVAAVGTKRIELCGAHADFNDPAKHQAPIDACKAAGVDILSIGVQTFTNNTKVERQWCEFAKKAGAKYISAHFKVDSFRESIASARALCEAYDLRIGIHCHGGYMFGGSVDILSHLLDLGGERIGLNIDTAWCMQSGNADPVDWAKRFQGRVFGIHYKDFVWDRAGKWSETIPGDGNLRLNDLLTTLDATGFDGYAVVEYEAQPENPAPAIAEAIKRIRG